MSTRAKAISTIFALMTVAGVRLCAGETPKPEQKAEAKVVATPPSRVVALAPNAAEIIFGLGAGDSLVGVSEFCTWPPELKDTPRIGGLRDPNLETLLALKPDMMVLRGRSGPARKLCEARKIPVYNDRVESLADLYRTIADLGAMLDRRAEAKRLSEQIRRKLERIRVRCAVGRPPRVLLTLRSPTSLSNVMTCGRETFLNELIEIAGGENIFGDQETDWPAVSMEEIVSRDPEIIIEAMMTYEFDAGERAAIRKQWAKLKTVSAVRSGRIHIVTDDVLTVPSQRVTESAEILAGIIRSGSGGGG